VCDRDAALARADRVARGEHQAYRWTWCARPQSASDWHELDSRSGTAGAPWFKVPHRNGTDWDIKDSWEPGRFAWAYDLARGWICSGENKYAEAFWQSLEQFAASAPPFRGVQWACGQETAIRAIALLWAEGALRDAPASTVERLALLRRLLLWSGERIDDAIGYALSQRNNHGISEAAGLVAIGARFAASSPARQAREWIEHGMELLEECVEDQFAADGWYAQHSFNYLRVALDQLVTAQRVLNSFGSGLSGASRSRIAAAVNLLAEVTDPVNGEPPLHGANDGASVMPLSLAGYRDMRPALTAAAATFAVPLRADIAPDEETLAWLGARPPAAAPAPAVPRVVTGESGWAHAVSAGARVFARAGAYRGRPGHIDAMHVDVWIGGKPVARDAGTYRYAAGPPWANGLAGEEVHNSITLDGHPMARRGPRFLWLSWPIARIARAELRGDGTILLVLANESWRSIGVHHEREIIVEHDAVVVRDLLRGDTDVKTEFALHWLVDASAGDISTNASVPVERDEVRGDAGSTRGWISEGYGDRRAATSIVVRGTVTRNAEIESRFGASIPTVQLAREAQSAAP
jgi:hypothetical protein